MVYGWIWSILTLISVIWVVYDVFIEQKNMKMSMKILWTIAALLLGVIGAGVYYYMNHYKK